MDWKEALQELREKQQDLLDGLRDKCFALVGSKEVVHSQDQDLFFDGDYITEYMHVAVQTFRERVGNLPGVIRVVKDTTLPDNTVIVRVV